ncbi:hypothetical protein [Methanovulcanius yangii]|nr:hypothetical protein [Methanovulcanius yangii]
MYFGSGYSAILEGTSLSELPAKVGEMKERGRTTTALMKIEFEEK